MAKTDPGQKQARAATASSGMPAGTSAMTSSAASSGTSAGTSSTVSSVMSSTASSAVSSIGIDIGGTKTLGVLLAADGSVLARSRRPTPIGGNGPVEEAVLGMIAVLVGEASALGAGHGLEHFAYLNIGTGIAAGFVLNGALFEGEEGRAGEIGHVVLRSDGPPCSCGKRGCLEVLASGSALAAQAGAAVLRHPGSLLAQMASSGEVGGDAAGGYPASSQEPGGDAVAGAVASAGDGVDGDAVGNHASAPMKAAKTGRTNQLSGARLLARAAEAGDPYAIALLDTAAAYLGQAAAWLVDTLGLQRVVLGGGVVQVGEALLGPLRRVAVDSMLEANRADRVVEATTLGTDGGAIGAALAGRTHHLRVQEVTCSE